MMKKFGKLGMALSLAASMALPQLAQAESRWSVGSGTGLSAHANLKLKVVVPKIIILRVGDFGGGLANTNTITWDATGTTANDDPYTGAIPPTSSTLPFNVTDDETDAAANGHGKIAVQVFGNAGVVRLKSETTASTIPGSTGGTSIPLSDFSVNDTGSITHPPFNGVVITLPANQYIVNLQDTWEYVYTPGTTPAAGTYTTTVTYTATNP